MYDFSRLPLPAPEGRANAIRASLAQIAGILKPHEHMLLSTLAPAFAILGTPRLDDTPPIAARRATCRDLAAAFIAAEHAEGYTPPPVSHAYCWFRAQIGAWTGSADPRLAAMAATAARELGELQLAERGD